MTATDPSADQALTSVEYRMREAGEWLKLEDGVIENLIAPRRVLEVSIPIRRDDGTRVRFTGWRVQHNITRGPGKGGLRYHPSVNRDETVSLAAAKPRPGSICRVHQSCGCETAPLLPHPRERESADEPETVTVADWDPDDPRHLAQVIGRLNWGVCPIR